MASTNVRRVVRREVTVWLNFSSSKETTVADLDAFLAKLREAGAEDETRVSWLTELSARLSATIPIPADPS